MNIQHRNGFGSLQAQTIFPILGDLSESELQELGRPRKIPRGTVLFRQGQEELELPLLLKGEVRVYKISESGRELSFSRLQPGRACVLAVNCIMQKTPFPAFAAADTDLEMLTVPGRLLKKFMQQYPSWNSFVWSLMSQCVHQVINVAEEVVCQSLDQRLAKYLSRHEAQSTLQKTHEHIAREINSTREVISRRLKVFEKQNLVSLGRRSVVILDPAGLFKLAQAN